MRRRSCVRAALPCALAALAVVPATAGAAPHHNHGLTIAATPNGIPAGTGVLIYGQLRGSDVAGQKIELFHRINPARGFSLISTTTTNQYGFYEFTRAEGVVTTNRNWYVVGPGRTHSRTIHEHVAATLTLAESASTVTAGAPVTFSGTVFPDHRFQRVLIQAQDSSAGSGWHTVAVARTGADSSFSVARRFRDPGDLTLRALLPGDQRNIAGTSDSVTLAVQPGQSPSFTLTSSSPAITVGQSTTLSGTLYAAGSTTTPEANTPVALYARRVDGKLSEIASTTTDAAGHYSFTESPTANTIYRVETTTKPVSRSVGLYEAVADSVSMTASATTVTAGTAVSFSGLVTPDHSGHPIYLQVQTPKGGWQIVAARRVGAGSRFDFSYRFGQPSTYTVRTRIFGGPENVGAASAPVGITVSGDASAATLPAGS